MGSMDSAFGGNFEGSFEPDDFYESFLAPKFHDFTAPEVPIDPDAYFMAKPGTLKKAFAVEEVKTAAPKIHKVPAVDALKPAATNHQQAPPKSPVAAEKAAVSADSAKKATRIASASPLTSKSLKNRNSATNSPAQPPVLEKNNSNGSLKPTSLAKKLQASENDDPNSPINNSPDIVPKAAKSTSALTRQRSINAHEEKPALIRQRSQKLIETKPASAAVDTHAGRKASGESCESKSNSEKEGDQRKENSAKPGATNSNGIVAAKANSSAVTSCKMSVKESISNQQEVKKPLSCMDIAGSPYSGHHCKSSRCAANDLNFSSPVPTKKYLVAKRDTPGSLRKATPSHAGGEKCNEEAADESQKDEGKKSEIPSVEEVQTAASKVKVKAKGALIEVFEEMALDKSLGVVVEKQTATVTMTAITELSKSDVGDLEKQTATVTMTAITELSKPDVGDLKEAPLGEDRSVGAPAQAILAADIRAWAGRSVNFEEIAASSSERPTETDESSNEEPKATGIDKFLTIASDCLENIDLNKINLPQSKKGKKRKSGELMPAGASKRANCSSEGTRSKAIPKKVSQVKEAAASKIPNKLRMRRLSVARRLSIARTKSRVTNPRPFRLRTEERGAVKEKEFIKKVAEFKAAKEGFHSAFQGLAVVEPKIPVKFLKTGHVFSAKRADPKTKDDKEAEAKTVKPAIPPLHKAPLFDHPFKPHRSSKKLTVPQDPKFHTVRGSRSCPSHVAPVPA